MYNELIFNDNFKGHGHSDNIFDLITKVIAPLNEDYFYNFNEFIKNEFVLRITDELYDKYPYTIREILEYPAESILTIEQALELYAYCNEHVPKINVQSNGIIHLKNDLSNCIISSNKLKAYEIIIESIDEITTTLKTASQYCKCNRYGGDAIFRRNYTKAVSKYLYNCDFCGKFYYNEADADLTEIILFTDTNQNSYVYEYIDSNKINIGDKIKVHGFDGDNNKFMCTGIDILKKNNSKGISNERNSVEYNKWRNNVLKRDNNSCQCCGLDKYLHVHHLFGYKEYPLLNVDINNGVTLCKWCHEKYHSIYGKKNINPVNFGEYIKKYGVYK